MEFSGILPIKLAVISTLKTMMAVHNPIQDKIGAACEAIQIRLEIDSDAISLTY